MAERGWRGWVRYGLPGLAVGLALSWSTGDRGPTARAQAPGQPGAGTMIPMPAPAADRSRAATPAAEAGSTGTMAFTAPTAGSAQLLYLIDTKTKAFAVYRVDPSNPKGTVKLEAARQYQWDLKLSEYNNAAPEVAAIESTVRNLGQASSR